jgi:hypothetical protein
LAYGLDSRLLKRLVAKVFEALLLSAYIVDVNTVRQPPINLDSHYGEDDSCSWPEARVRERPAILTKIGPRTAAGSCVFVLICFLPTAQAVILLDTGDPNFNTTAPTGELAGSGWQYEGLWVSFLGTAVASNFFITAKHVGGSVGDTFTL